MVDVCVNLVSEEKTVGKHFVQIIAQIKVNVLIINAFVRKAIS